MKIGDHGKSVIGPVLFLMYINDLPHASSLMTILFADDTTFTISGSNIEELFKTANDELSRASDWFLANKLVL